MATGITVKIAKEHLHLWLEAEAAIATAQSYQIGTRLLTRADLDDVRAEIEYWSDKLAEAEAAEDTSGNGGRNRVYRIVPRDL